MKTTSTHDMVKESYTDMLKGAQENQSCCTSSPAAKLAGYEDAERHGEAASASFGCGNPLAFAGVQQGDSVLDLGSGGGIDVILSARRVGPTGRAIGVDMTDEMLALARKNAAEAQMPNVEFRKGDIEQLPLDEAEVDVIISNCVINLSVDKPKVLAEAFRRGGARGDSERDSAESRNVGRLRGGRAGGGRVPAPAQRCRVRGDRDRADPDLRSG